MPAPRHYWFSCVHCNQYIVSLAQRDHTKLHLCGRLPKTLSSALVERSSDRFCPAILTESPPLNLAATLFTEANGYFLHLWLKGWCLWLWGLHMYICMYMCTYVRTVCPACPATSCTNTCIDASTHTCIHTNIHTYITCLHA